MCKCVCVCCLFLSTDCTILCTSLYNIYVGRLFSLHFGIVIFFFINNNKKEKRFVSQNSVYLDVYLCIVTIVRFPLEFLPKQLLFSFSCCCVRFIFILIFAGCLGFASLPLFRIRKSVFVIVISPYPMPCETDKHIYLADTEYTLAVFSLFSSLA